MAILDLNCENSILFNTVVKQGYENCNILLGENNLRYYWSYLKFNIPQLLNEVDLVSAKLVLFKIPMQNYDFLDRGLILNILPALEYVSKYSYMYGNISLDKNYEVNFKSSKKTAYIEVDITNIVRSWLNRKIDNNGIMVYLKNNKRFICVGGANSKSKALIPFIRVKYNNKCTCINTHKPCCENKTSIDLPVRVRINKQ